MNKSYTIYDPLVNAYRQVNMTDEQVELYYTSAIKVKAEKTISDDKEKDNEQTNTSNS
jgi:hypothetical protein